MSLPDLLDTATLSVEEQRAVMLFRRQGRLPQAAWESPISDARGRYDGGGIDALTTEDNQYVQTFHSIMNLSVFDGLDVSLTD